MKEELRKRRSWLDGFMAYPAPAGLSETQLRENIILLDQALYELWNLGQLHTSRALMEEVAIEASGADKEKALQWLAERG